MAETSASCTASSTISIRAEPTRFASSAISRPDSRRNRSATRRCAPGSVDGVDFTQLDPAKLVVRPAREQRLRLLITGRGYGEEAGDHILRFGVWTFADDHLALVHAQMTPALIHEFLSQGRVPAGAQAADPFGIALNQLLNLRRAVVLGRRGIFVQ